jgi:hypothetical protein
MHYQKVSYRKYALLPVRGESLNGLVVTGKTVNTGLDKNETELGIEVLAVDLEVLADVDGLLDKAVEVLRDLGGKTVGLEDAENLVSGDVADLTDSVGVTEDDTDLRGGKTLLGELANVLVGLGGGGLQPAGGSALVGQSGGRKTLTGGVHASHDG